MFNHLGLTSLSPLLTIISMEYRRWMLERKLADADVTAEEQMNMLKFLEKKETEYMRVQRHKMGVEDFEHLTIIGRGAFGEVLLFLFVVSHLNFTLLSVVLFLMLVSNLFILCNAIHTIFKFLQYTSPRAGKYYPALASLPPPFSSFLFIVKAPDTVLNYYYFYFWL